MLTQVNNIHHSKVPAIGAIGYLTQGTDRFGSVKYWHGRRQRYEVVAYPLNDNAGPYSHGIHTAWFRNLRTGQIVRMSGFYFTEDSPWSDLWNRHVA